MYVEVKVPTVRRIIKIGFQSTMALLIFYSIFTVAGYISLGTLMQDPNFDIYPNKQPVSTDPHDIHMKLLKVLFIACLMVIYVIDAIPLKFQIIAEAGFKDSDLMNIGLAFGIVSISGVLSYVYP